MRNRNFNNEWKKCSETLRNCCFPMDSGTLDHEIRRAIWDDNQHQPAESKAPKRQPHRWRIPASVAACLAAVLIPICLHGVGNDAIKTVEYEGQRVAFACNDGCTLDNTIKSFNDFVKNSL